MAPRLPDAGLLVLQPAKREISRFPNKERLHMPGSTTTPGQPYARNSAYGRLAFRVVERVGAQKIPVFAAQWLACALPYRRFACLLTKVSARLGVDADRYSLIAVDFHHLLLAGFSGAPTIWMGKQNQRATSRATIFRARS
jgi:hypothetical protein